MIYSQKTGKKWCPILEHPVGKYFLAMYPYKEPITEFLMEKHSTDSWLSTGFPLPARKSTNNGKEITLLESKIWYFDNKQDAIQRLVNMYSDWGQCYNVYLVSSKGFRVVKRGKDIHKTLD